MAFTQTHVPPFTPPTPPPHTHVHTPQVELSPGQPPLPVQHLELSGDSWTAEVAGRRLRGNALLFTHAGEQVLTIWQDGRSYEFRWVWPARVCVGGGAAGGVIRKCVCLGERALSALCLLL